MGTKNDAPLLMNLIKNKSVGFSWEYMFTRSVFETKDMSEQGKLLNEVAFLVEKDVLRSTRRENLGELSAASLREAYVRIEFGRTIGKLALNGL